MSDAAAGRVQRFDIVTRTVHWLTAALCGVLLLTGSMLYIPELSAVIGRRAVLKEIHVVSGLVLIVPLVIGVLLGPAGRGLRADLVTLGRWDRSDRRWLRRRTRTTPSGKFNGGQKLVTALFGGAFVAQLLTGALMNWNHPFPDDWRTGATFVHDWAYLVLVVLTLGHVGKALNEPELRRSMITGWVARSWARHERPGWLAAEDRLHEGAPVSGADAADEPDAADIPEGVAQARTRGRDPGS